jgi:hypothetical protein
MFKITLRWYTRNHSFVGVKAIINTFVLRYWLITCHDASTHLTGDRVVYWCSPYESLWFLYFTKIVVSCRVVAENIVAPTFLNLCCLLKLSIILGQFLSRIYKLYLDKVPSCIFKHSRLTCRIKWSLHVNVNILFLVVFICVIF